MSAKTKVVSAWKDESDRIIDSINNKTGPYHERALTEAMKELSWVLPAIFAIEDELALESVLLALKQQARRRFEDSLELDHPEHLPEKNEIQLEVYDNLIEAMQEG